MIEFPPREFSFIPKEDERQMFDDAYKTITLVNAWDAMKLNPGDGGYMYSKTLHPDIEKIRVHMNYKHHTGESYGLTMRSMQYIATQGWEAFRRLYV